MTIRATVVCVLFALSACSETTGDADPDAGAGPMLSWTPESIDCGYTLPGVASRHVVTFQNGGDAPVHLTHFDTARVLGVMIRDAEGQAISELTVPASAVAPLVVEFIPPALGAMQLTFSFRTDVPGMPTGSIPLRCFGGGPDVKVTPSPILDFGRVANTPGTYQTRRLRVENNGASAREGDVEGNLKVSAIEVHPVVPTTADEIQVIRPEPNDSEIVLEPWSGKNLLEIEVKLTPTEAEGARGAGLLIKTNDPDEPEVLIDVRAEVVAVVDCRFSVEPEFVDVSGISGPDYRDIPFTVTSIGTDPCIVSTLRVEEGSTLPLSLPEAPDSVEIPRGESHEFVVRVAPSSTTRASGRVLFFVSDSTRPEAAVEFSAP